MKPVVVFGTSQFADITHFYLAEDSPRRVAAFTVDGAYVESSRFCGLPVVAFEDLAAAFPPDRYDMFVAVGPQKLNGVRADKCCAAEAAGYKLISYVSSGVRVQGKPEIAPNTFVTDMTAIGAYVRLGRGVVLWGARIAHHCVIHDYALLSACTLGGGVEVGERSFIGLNSTVRDQVKVGARCVLGAGTLILRDTEDDQVFQGRSTRPSQVPSSWLEHA